MNFYEGEWEWKWDGSIWGQKLLRLEGVYVVDLSAIALCGIHAGPLVMELVHAEPHGQL